MIDVENSFKRFNSLKKLAENGYGYISPTLYESEIETIIQALEKQIPKKPIELDKWGEYYECPICNKYAVDNLGCKYKFCRECGQKLDW